MGQAKPFSNVCDADIARALEEIPLYGWPRDEGELVSLFGRMLHILVRNDKDGSFAVMAAENISGECAGASITTLV